MAAVRDSTSDAQSRRELAFSCSTVWRIFPVIFTLVQPKKQSADTRIPHSRAMVRFHQDVAIVVTLLFVYYIAFFS